MNWSGKQLYWDIVGIAYSSPSYKGGGCFLKMKVPLPTSWPIVYLQDITFFCENWFSFPSGLPKPAAFLACFLHRIGSRGSNQRCHPEGCCWEDRSGAHESWGPAAPGVSLCCWSLSERAGHPAAAESWSKSAQPVLLGSKVEWKWTSYPLLSVVGRAFFFFSPETQTSYGLIELLTSLGIQECLSSPFPLPLSVQHNLTHPELSVAVEMLSSVALINRALESGDMNTVWKQLSSSVTGLTNIEEENCQRWVPRAVNGIHQTAVTLSVGCQLSCCQALWLQCDPFLLFSILIHFILCYAG